MRIILYWKPFFTIASISVLVFLYISEHCLTNVDDYLIPTEKTELITQDYVDGIEDEKNLKYILLWTSPLDVPFIYMGKGREGFIQRNCEYQNCVIIHDRKYFGDYTLFDVIAFAGPEVQRMCDSVSMELFPQKRSPHQKFVFASIESADNYPVCLPFVDGFFNWTWTYRLDSERRWGAIIIRDVNGTVIGPKHDMHWIKLEDMQPVDEKTKTLLRNKTKAVAWFVSNCNTRSNREAIAKDLSYELSKFNLGIDIYGKCGNYTCSRGINEMTCNNMLQRDYFFYLSFENSFSEDYVTEKLLHALEFKTIPIVLGTANYTRFMPDGAYLNAKELGVKKLAQKINELINDIDKYAEYFKWTNHYRYHGPAASKETDEYCGFCSILNDKEKVKQVSVYENFREWWNPPNQCG